MPEAATVVRLAAAPPPGPLAEDTFSYTNETMPNIAPGEILVESLVAAVDAGSRAALDDRSDYVVKTRIGGRVVASAVLGLVVRSRHDAFPEGAHVRVLMAPRATHLRVDPARTTVDLIDADRHPIEAYAGVLGANGLTAWIGVFDVARARPGDTVLVSAAAGAVGSAAGQFARAVGARVVGIAGGAKKCDFVRNTLGFSDCIDYKSTPDLREAIAAACPDGVDVYFENVGGEIQRIALDLMNDRGRIAMCGQVSQYSGQGQAPGPNLMPIILKRLEVRGFLVTDHLHEMPRFQRAISDWLDDGVIQHHATVVAGLHRLHDAINSLTAGKNIGQQLHRMEVAT